MLTCAKLAGKQGFGFKMFEEFAFFIVKSIKTETVPTRN
jgi:hypothetical protein